MATTDFTAPVGSWLEVATGLSDVLISHNAADAVKVHVGTSAPAPDAAGHRCTQSAPFSMSGVPGLNAYVQSAASSPIVVTVTAA